MVRDLEAEMTLERYLAADEQERRQFSAIPRRLQLIVMRRLAAIDRYLQIEKPTAGDADHFAAQIDMGRSNFYRLVEKLREEGPVAGLAPGLGRKKRFASVVDGLGDIVELTIQKVLAEDPDASLRKVEVAIEDACDEFRVVKPSEWTVRDRLNAIRGSPAISAKAGSKGARFGRRFLIDQCATSLLIRADGKIEHSIITAIIDLDTRLIAGMAVAEELPRDKRITAALADMVSRSPMILGRIKPADRLESVHWVVPDHMQSSVLPWARGLAEQGIEATFDSEGERRFGKRLLRILGSPFGGYKLLPRLTPSPQAERDDRDMVEVPVANSLFVAAADAWNYEIVRLKMRAQAAVSEAARAQQEEKWRSEDSYVKTLGNDFDLLMRSALMGS